MPLSDPFSLLNCVIPYFYSSFAQFCKVIIPSLCNNLTPKPITHIICSPFFKNKKQITRIKTRHICLFHCKWTNTKQQQQQQKKVLVYSSYVFPSSSSSSSFSFIFDTIRLFNDWLPVCWFLIQRIRQSCCVARSCYKEKKKKEKKLFSLSSS